MSDTETRTLTRAELVAALEATAAKRHDYNDGNCLDSGEEADAILAALDAGDDSDYEGSRRYEANERAWLDTRDS